MLISRICLLLAAFVIAPSHGRPSVTKRTKRQSQSCPESEDGHRGFLCPLAAAVGEKICITARQLCDGAWDCSRKEDEHPIMCLFYKAIRYEMYNWRRPSSKSNRRDSTTAGNYHETAVPPKTEHSLPAIVKGRPARQHKPLQDIEQERISIEDAKLHQQFVMQHHEDVTLEPAI